MWILLVNGIHGKLQVISSQGKGEKVYMIAANKDKNAGYPYCLEIGNCELCFFLIFLTYLGKITLHCGNHEIDVTLGTKLSHLSYEALKLSEFINVHPLIRFGCQDCDM